MNNTNKSMVPIVMMAIRKVYKLFLSLSENKILEIKKNIKWTVKKDNFFDVLDLSLVQ